MANDEISKMSKKELERRVRELENQNNRAADLEIAYRKGWNAHCDYLEDHHRKAVDAAMSMMAAHYLIKGMIIAADENMRTDLLREHLPLLGGAITGMSAENQRVINFFKTEFNVDMDEAFETDLSMTLLELVKALYSEDRRESKTAERNLRAFIEESDILRDALRFKMEWKRLHAKQQAFKPIQVIDALCESAQPYFEAGKNAPEVVSILYDLFYSIDSLTDSQEAQLQQLETWDEGDGDAARNLLVNYDRRWKLLP